MDECMDRRKARKCAGEALMTSFFLDKLRLVSILADSFLSCSGFQSLL